MTTLNSNLPDKRIKDLTGKRFGRLVAIEFVHIKNHEAYWLCDCDCGKRVTVSGHSLRRGATKSCGCYSSDVHAAAASKTFRKDMVGKKFGQLTVLRYSHTHIFNELCSEAKWICLCDCGNETIVFGSHLRKGATRSCGCIVLIGTDNPNFKHGISNKKHPHHYILSAWYGIIQRTQSKTAKRFEGWGGRGISIAPQWRHDSTRFVKDVLAEIGERPTPKHSIDRINNEGHYEPSNIRWATPSEQNRNKRTTRLITAGGRTQCLTDWGKEIGRNPGVISARLDDLGWTPEEAVEIVQRTKPTRKR